VNLTETMNSLSMSTYSSQPALAPSVTVLTYRVVTKAGAANNKIFVGEASYGRSFHMAKNGCWGPTCDFTGSRTQSDATPGRCTNTGGYLGYAEIAELVGTADGLRMFHDAKSDSDIIIYNGPCKLFTPGYLYQGRCTDKISQVIMSAT
jgi:hypothetical protein